MKTLTASLVFIALVSGLRASQEGILPLSSFYLESDGIGASGKVVVEGKQDSKKHLIELKVIAFGKEYVVQPDKLAQLADLPANGVRISYEAGYANLGGRVVYVQLQMGFTSSTRKDAYISVTESGEIRVREVKYHDA